MTNCTQSTGVPVERCIYKPGLHCFTLVTRDEYGNTLTSEIIRGALAVGAGPLDIDSDKPSLEVIRKSCRRSSKCHVEYKGGGRYELKCSVLRVGKIPLVLQIPPLSFFATFVNVVPEGVVCPQHCWLDPTNTYKCNMLGYATLYIYLYDQYYNPYYHQDGRGVLCANVILSTQVFNTILHKARYGKRPRYKFDVGPISNAIDLRVKINDSFIADPPKKFTVLCTSLEERLARFRSLPCFSRSDDTIRPIIHIDRNKILESALEYNNVMRRGSIHVNFIGEFGIDMGGVSRYNIQY